MQDINNDIPKVLMVDDKPENLVFLKEMLSSLDLEIFIAFNGYEALKLMKLNNFDLVLLDILMPKMNGYELCTKLKKNPTTMDIPVIFLSALQGVEDRIKGFEVGGDDYLNKPLIAKEVCARVLLHLQKRSIVKALKRLLKQSYHELYNPLAIINSSIEMHDLQYGSNKYTNSVMVASKTLQLIYEDLYYSLSFSKELEKYVAIDICEFILERISYFSLLTQTKDIKVNFKGKSNSSVYMRKSDLQRIVDNTLSNAIKYSKQHSEISVYIIEEEVNIVFLCRNNGIVIHNPDRVFQSNSKNSFETIGMGIGLEIVSSICRVYKIKTQVISENQKTIFRYEIPKYSSI